MWNRDLFGIVERKYIATPLIGGGFVFVVLPLEHCCAGGGAFESVFLFVPGKKSGRQLGGMLWEELPTHFFFFLP